MRLPLAVDIDSRDGTSNKDARMTNMLSENDQSSTLAVVRPGLSSLLTATGNGNGVVSFNDVLISVYGTALGCRPASSIVSIGTVMNGAYDFVQSPL